VFIVAISQYCSSVATVYVRVMLMSYKLVTEHSPVTVLALALCDSSVELRSGQWSQLMWLCSNWLVGFVIHAVHCVICGHRTLLAWGLWLFRWLYYENCQIVVLMIVIL